MNNNQCVACGQWSGKGHRCPTPTTTTPARPTASVATISPTVDVTDRVARAREAMLARAAALAAEAENLTPEQLFAADREEARDRVREGSAISAYEVHDENGQPLGVITVAYDDYADNPREEDPDSNVGKVTMLRGDTQMDRLKEVAVDDSVWRDYVPSATALEATRYIREEYPDAEIVFLTLNDTATGLRAVGPDEARVDAIGVIDRDTINGEFGGSKPRAVEALEQELTVYGQWRTGSVYRATYKSVDGESEVYGSIYAKDYATGAAEVVREDCSPAGSRLGPEIY